MHHYKDYINGSRYQKLVCRRFVRIDHLLLDNPLVNEMLHSASCYFINVSVIVTAKDMMFSKLRVIGSCQYFLVDQLAILSHNCLMSSYFNI